MYSGYLKIVVHTKMFIVYSIAFVGVFFCKHGNFLGFYESIIFTIFVLLKSIILI